MLSAARHSDNRLDSYRAVLLIFFSDRLDTAGIKQESRCYFNKIHFVSLRLDIKVKTENPWLVDSQVELLLLGGDPVRVVAVVGFVELAEQGLSVHHVVERVLGRGVVVGNDVQVVRK